MILIGILLGLVGTDVNSGVERFTFGMPQLWPTASTSSSSPSASSPSAR